MSKTTGLKTFALVMLISGAVDNIRNLPATALFGTSLIFFFIFASVVFLIPAALVSAELSAKWPEKGGIFHWARMAFGEKIGFLAIWLQWISNVVWFPTILSFIAGTATYLIAPELAQNKFFLVAAILGVFWVLTLINLKGINVSAKFNTFCIVTGMILPMALIIILALIWLVSHNPSQIHFTSTNIIPRFNDPQHWISLTAIMTAFLGMELSTVHIKDVENPEKTFPKALFYSVGLILLTMILGSLAIAIVLPQNHIQLVNGVMQAFANFFAAYHLSWIMPLIAALIMIGTSGSIISWIISPLRGLLQAAQYDFLPDFFKKQNQHGASANLLVGQAILVSFICLAFLLMPSVNGSYWLLTALSTQLYMLMYIIMFVAAIILRIKHPHQKSNFTIPGGQLGLWLWCLLGLTGCVITLIVGFIPPSTINIGSVFHYEMIFVGGMLAMMAPVLLCYIYKNKSMQKFQYPTEGLPE